MNRHTLKKVEAILEEVEYQLIYEKGSFTSGYCLVENKNIVVINKFFDIEARINCIIEILEHINIDQFIISKESRSFLRKLTYQQEELPIIEQ